MRPLALALLFAALFAGTAHAEVRTIAATGEYRMGDNDTRTDAKRLALQDAKRLALEKAGTYIEGITEVKNFQLSRDELRAYTAGIVEVTEQQTKSTMEGDTQVVRVDVTCKIDTAVVARQIETLRRNETVKADLLRAQQEAERLRQENEGLRQKLAAATSKPEIQALQEKRRENLTDQDVNSLLSQAWVALAGSDVDSMTDGASSASGRAKARRLLEVAFSLDSSEPWGHLLMGVLLGEEGNLEGEIASYRTALRLNPEYMVAHHNLAVSLMHRGDIDGAMSEIRTAMRLNPNVPEIHYSLGDILYRKNDLDGSIAAFRNALRLKPNYLEAHEYLGLMLYYKQQYDEAIAELRAALTLNPARAGIRLKLGLALKANGQRREAAQEFREYLRLVADTPANREWIEKARSILRELE